jgi:hypothetical protein
VNARALARARRAAHRFSLFSVTTNLHYNVNNTFTLVS